MELNSSCKIMKAKGVFLFEIFISTKLNEK
jgi:hypothetical protein